MSLHAPRIAVALLTAAALTPARGLAQTRGSGTTWDSAAPSPTRNEPPATKASRPPSEGKSFDDRRGLLGAPGAGQDKLGGSRLGVRAEVQPIPPEGSWVAGDRTRSLSSADVRAARAEQAPDLEWVTAQGTEGQGAAPSERVAEPGRDGGHATAEEGPAPQPEPEVSGEQE